MRAELIAAKLQIAQLSGANLELRQEVSTLRRQINRAGCSSNSSLWNSVAHLSLRDRPVKPTESDKQSPVAFHGRPVQSEADRRAIAQALTGHKTFNAFDVESIDQVAQAMVALDFGPGDTVIYQGDDTDDRFFVVSSGEYSVFVAGQGDSPKHTYQTGGCFGEIALRYGTSRKATVRCVVGGTLWALKRADYLAHMGRLKGDR